MAPIERVTDELDAPALDDRSYRVIRLPNKLEALLVHDPDTDKAGAAVNVNVGSFSDPDDMPGMAHAVEHLLFMGTKKVHPTRYSSNIADRPQYPKENDYNEYLSAHSGYSNAYTAATETNYYFEVAASSETDSGKVTNGASSSLYGALDRFAQFFISPLFLSSTLDRELKAVDSENKKNLQSDNWRLSQLSKSLSSKKHPYHHFSTGNLQTLRDEPRERGVDVRKEFIHFHGEHYSANRMKLVVLGKESLDELETWVGELFAGVHNKDLPQKRWDGLQPLTKLELMTQIFAKPVMDQRTLEICFPYQDEEFLYDSQPSRYISHLIGHEGPGSILAFTKAKGWANELSAGPSSVCPGSALFQISIKLTEEGLNVYREIVEIVFQYISLIKEKPPQEWIVDEVKGMSEVDFKFQEKSSASNFVRTMCSTMQKPLPRKWLLSATDLIRKFDGDAISKALGYLRADNYRLTIVSQRYPGEWPMKERWYGTEYNVEPISPEFAAMVKKAEEVTSKDRIPDLHLPHKNEFIPSKLTVEKKDVTEMAKAPKLIRNDELVRTWWKKDDKFWVPRANVFVTLRNPLAATLPSTSVKTRMFCQLVKDALGEYSYDAEIAGLEYELGDYNVGIGIDVSGYNDKISVLLEKVLVTMRDLEVKPDRFEIVKERMLRGYRNWDFQQPYHQVGEFTTWLSSDKAWVNEQYLAEAAHLTPEDISNFYPQLLRQVHLEILCHGNVYKEDALRITDMVETTLKPRALPATQWQMARNLILAPGSDYTFQRKLGDPANVNHCIEYYIFVGDVVDRVLRAKLLLLGQMTEEAGFDQLRTKEQLGYIVFTGVKMQATTMGYRIIIQSERPTEYLEERINAFLAHFGKSLQAMSTEDFESHKSSLIAKRLEKIKNLDQESSRFWSHISNEYLDFLSREHDVSHLKPLTRSDLIDFFNHYIHPTSPSRAKLSVHMIAQASPKEVAGNISPAEQKEKVISMLGKYLTAMGIDADQEKLTKRFDDVDVPGGDQAGIIHAVAEYLDEDVEMAEEEANEVLVQGQQLLGTILPSLGVEVKQAVDGVDGVEKLPEAPPVKKATPVENVREFKAGLQLTIGRKPVTDLSEFLDTESKL
ncbi:Insulinase (Peptidase M16) [Imshaugia aleurites]|uniref:Insulinase (Peptidase M16) n=1 Tax=Imshaugia aleurites TaxID=172621 RepID=A0A8H3F0I3_9LECA|nr:Insulinase (Peptidase M16) [Imshaugia aleurites]